MVLLVMLVALFLVRSLGANDARNVQRFVKIDVSKINVKNTSEPSNGSSTTTTETTEGTSTVTVSTLTSTTVPSNITSTEVAETSTAATTESTTGTTSVPQVTTTVEPTKPIDVDPPFPPLKEGRAAKLVPRGYYCQCDLKINACDVNCCCDIDCSEAILRAFNCDEEQLQRDEYHHDEGLQSCRVQGGLFCLIEPIHEEGDESHYDPKKLPEATRHKWKDVFPIDPNGAEDVRGDHYRVGDIVYFFNESSEAVQPFALPYSLTDSGCQFDQPVRFLRAASNLCRRTVDELAAFNRAFLLHHQSARFFRTPKKSTVMEHYCVEEQDCINVTLSVCHSEVDGAPGTGWNCSQSLNTTSGDALLESLEEDVDGGGAGCGRLEVDFHYNYTHLLGVKMTLFCRPNSPDTWSDSFVWQRVAVNFPVASGKRSNVSRTVSGNLGYLIGKPLIVSHLELAANGTTPATAPVQDPSSVNGPKPLLAYFTNGTRLPDETFRLRLPVSRSNRCTAPAEGSSYQTINFGVNSWHRCNFVPLNTTTNVTGQSVTQNYTQFCRDLQDALYAHLLHGVRTQAGGPAPATEGYDNLNLYLSRYANPINRTADWIRVRSVNVIPDARVGSESDAVAPLQEPATADHFTCSNMLINVDLRFYYGRERVREVRRQAILHDAEVVFGPRVNLRFRRDEEVRVPIFVQVQFFDLTSSASMLGGGPPSTNSIVLLIGLCLVFCVF